MTDLIIPATFAVSVSLIVAGTWIALGFGAALIAFGFMGLVAFTVLASA